MRISYANITLKGPTQEVVVDYMNGIGRKTFVSPTIDGVTVVFDEECDTRDVTVLKVLSEDLSRHFDCIALAVLNYNDDILWYALYQSGRLIDQYNSTPDYFKMVPSDPISGDAAKLCFTFGADGVCNDNVEKILRGPYETAAERHRELIRTLDLAFLAIGTGYNHLVELARDDLPGIRGGVSTGG